MPKKQTPKNRRHYRLLLECMAVLGRVRVKEGFIPGDEPGEIVHGMARGQDIYVNPVPSTVDTILHEVLHVLKPDWSERTVKSYTTRLCTRLTEDEMRQIWNIYRDKLR